MASTARQFVYEHAFLPPKLPQSDHHEEGADFLLKQVSKAAHEFWLSMPVGASDKRVVEQMLPSLLKWIDVYAAGTPCCEVIIDTLQNMRNEDILFFYMEPQNATLLVRNRSTGAVFECFEVLPTTDAVMATKDALLRTFPARAVFLPKEALQDTEFMHELGTAIFKLSVEQLRMAMETTTKGKNVVSEDRQSAHPMMVTEWLFGILSTRGKATASPTIHKRTHDDVCWKDAARPWRRSGVYLSTRVALQIAFQNAGLADDGHSLYKNFMLYLLSSFATEVQENDQSPDMLHVLRAKLARRNAKLGPDTLPSVQLIVRQTLQRIDEVMQSQWREVVVREQICVPSVPASTVTDQLTLKQSTPHLNAVWQLSKTGYSYRSIPYTPTAQNRVQLHSDILPKADMFCNSGDLLCGLADFEQWVADHLDDWLEHNQTSRHCCSLLADLITFYHDSAKKKYNGNPMRMSMMLLTMFDLWVKLDIIVTNLQPLLLDYPPEIDMGIFEPILLNKKCELERLALLEGYISDRGGKCNTNNPSLFSNPTSDCFAVKYYRKSQELLLLRSEIEQEAHLARDEKSCEWEEKKRLYQRLKEEAANAQHDKFTFRYGRKAGSTTHDRNCRKCAKERTAANIKIDKHEWPLPNNDVYLMAVVFELGAPQEIVLWRDTAWYLVQEVGRSTTVQGEIPKQQLLSYQPLRHHAQHRTRRITLASSVKPMEKAHYFKAGLVIDEIFVKNAMNFIMNDSAKATVWTSEQTARPSLQPYCKSKIPTGSGRHIDQQVNGTTHTQNSVIATHSACPTDMGAHEYLLFGTLRSGERLQYINVLAALMSSEIDLNSPLTALLFLHATSQVGKLAQKKTDYLRESQVELANLSFCRSLLEALVTRFAAIETNWKEATAAGVLLELTLKICSLVSACSDECATLLLRIRRASIQWIRQLADLHAEKRGASDVQVSLGDISRQMLKCCILTRRTYDVDHCLQSTLCFTAVAAEDYIEASIHLHDHLNQQFKTDHDVKLHSDILEDSYKARLFQRPFLSWLAKESSAISRGVQRFWRSASFDLGWKVTHQNDQSWLENKCLSKSVHFNLVTGNLLVCGRPLSRLPNEYRANPLYRSIFHDLDLDVFTADVEDMEYMSRTLFEGHRIYLGMRSGVLLIRSQLGSNRFEALLGDKFLEDLPTVLVKDSVPWMDLDDGTVAFRSRQSLWKTCSSDWVLRPTLNSQTTTTMRSDQSFLIDYDSLVGRAICQTFESFEKRNHIVISKNQETGIEIWLPRFRLHFSVDPAGDIKCKEFSAVVDSFQAIGTLHGLQSRLVLRAVGKAHGSIVRTVLIPNGDLRLTAAAPHLKVNIRVGSADYLSFAQYRIDNRLGQLISSDLESHIYKAYLHAVTSFPEPDALTGRTGTEESLLNLSDPVNRTSIPLSPRAQQLLQSIAELSPRRNWYPQHMQVMHSDKFHNVLSSYAQRDIFFGTVGAVISHNRKANFLFDAQVKSLVYSNNAKDQLLLDRSHRHTCKLYPTDSVSWSGDAVQDNQYKSRDRNIGSNQEAASTIAGLVDTWPSAFSVTNLKAVIQGWKEVTGFHEEFKVISFANVLVDPMHEQFPRLFNLCSSPSVSKRELVFILSLMAFGNPKNTPVLRTLLALAVSPALRNLPPFEHNSYDLGQGSAIDYDEMETILEQCEKEFTPVSDSEVSESEEEADTQSQKDDFLRDLAQQRRQILAAVKSSWPSASVTLPPRRSLDCYKFGELRQLLDVKFAAWHKNYVFLSQLDAFDQNLRTVNQSWYGPNPINTVVDLTHSGRRRTQTTRFALLDIMRSVDVSMDDFGASEPSGLDHDLARTIAVRQTQQTGDTRDILDATDELETMVEMLEDQSGETFDDYARFLRDSITALKSKVADVKIRFDMPDALTLIRKAGEVKKRISYLLHRCRELLQPRDDAARGLVMARLWPQVNEMALLQLLVARHRSRVPFKWIQILTLFAQEITALQRVERIQRHIAAGDDFALQRELANPAHDAWSIGEHPDWLLLEIQNNLLIRPIQVRVALEIMERHNGLVLLGMGEGKTSVILPMVVTALANGSHLVRVVVLKPLANEMLRQLSRSLAGLCGRTECCQEEGVLLSLPEHQNSFRLVGADCLTGGDPRLAAELIRVQKWLDRNSRDILDESDELLKPGYELVYTNGEANILSGAPDRWVVALEILALLQDVAAELHHQLPEGIEYEIRGPGAFPHVRILNDDGAEALTGRIVRAIVEGKLPSLPLGHCNVEVLQAIGSFLHDMDVDDTAYEKIRKHFQDSAQLNTLYVVRGLISHQTLSHALRKRWLVNYGLDRSRCLSAVPYRAKSIPSPSAEFAQPEMMIVLTALSWLYTGVEREDLRRCIVVLLKSSDPSHEYTTWVRESNVPSKYRSSNCINLDDATFLDELYGHLKDSRAVIDFFLRFLVYPREAKEFQHKLSSSTWDLCATDGGKVTSGFSGTCDSRVPSTCFQKDLEDLRHSTALTLATLLRQDNRHYVCAASSSGRRLTTGELLRLVVNQQPSPSVIIDVGAQILESNQEVAAKWLRLQEAKMAAIYFNDNDEKMVLNRDGTTEPFVSSIFKDEVGGCLIYLDEFHTRGTDFQLPDDFQAGVLLGPGLLKDNLAQACMRMRKLAVSQSVRFFAPPEVDNSIRAFLQQPAGAIDSSHVVRWAIHQSCQALKSQKSIWTLRGLSHSRRRIASTLHLSDDGQVIDPDRYLETIRERESRPVTELYGIRSRQERKITFEPTANERVDPIMRDLLMEWERIDVTDLTTCGISEEQEREVLHEIEQEREVQRSQGAKPAVPKGWDGLDYLIRHGRAPESAAGFYQAFDALKNTRLKSQYVPADWPMHVVVTEDFLRTIETTKGTGHDDFLRPVQWVLKAAAVKQPIIISPHEAQIFLPLIRESKHSTLILYQARTGRSMAAFDSMGVYRVPERDHVDGISAGAITTLNLFAGQLYFTTFDDYRRLCSLIGLWDGERSLTLEREVANDNFVSPACRQANGWTGCTFKRSPVKLLKAFINMRRLGIEWNHTHMGRVLSGRFLRKEDFEDDLISGVEGLNMTEN
ncbi:hypothetical protein LTR20_005937 [Exophiala xenobiotica]|nr:hypothetical protein LTS13_003094 [Exophiala xenobiotica]KAK5396087.1 hypothetical protein LTR79_006841 [Exophiala xenobiotica]KAK5424040.1 hypothetical protein LTR90_001386 [Exophiala xenobiotica]KAK5461988.1 hypothetical protein LTR20_005937 [Exophiala xenobiotica]KAK5479843.1 hypothetical protein LTR26_007696 [Exophiala xenobiotica]